MISQTAEYALRAAVRLASAYPEPSTAQHVSDDVGVPVPYLAKVLNTLARAGIVSSQRGKNGGFALLRPPAEVTVLDVVQAVDPLIRLHRCPLGRPDHAQGLCPLHRRLDEAVARTEEAFRGTPLGDLIGMTDGSASPFDACLSSAKVEGAKP